MTFTHYPYALSVGNFEADKYSNIFDAILDADFEAVKRFVEVEKMDVNQAGECTTHYEYPLHYAVLMGRVKIVECLLSKGANPEQGSLYGTAQQTLDKSSASAEIKAQISAVLTGQPIIAAPDAAPQ